MNKNNLSNQHGMASLVFVMLIGLAITASTVGVVRTIRNAQEIHIATNAVTHSQTGAWSAVAAFEAYLETLDVLSLQAFNGSRDIAIEMDSRYGTITAKNVNSQEVSVGVYHVTADITNIHSAAKSATTLSVVYEVILALKAMPVMNFNDDLKITGEINLISDGLPMNIRVDGDADLNNVGLDSLNELVATGNVSLGSNVGVNILFANGSVDIGSNDLGTVSTLGDFSSSGSGSAENVFANGDVLINSSGRFGNVNSVGDIEVLTAGGGGHGTFTAGGDVTITAGPIDAVNAVGDIKLSFWQKLGRARGMSDVICVSPHWEDFDSIRVNGTLSSCHASAVTNANVTVTPMAPLEPRTIPRQYVDVWKLMPDVNYFIEWDSTVSKIKVTVNDVAGYTDGDSYYLGRYSNDGGTPPYIDYLCSSVDGGGNCTAPVAPLSPLCFGYSPWNGCISYNTGTKKFTLSPAFTAPGIMLFDGSLDLNSGSSVTTFLASGDITTGGLFVGWSVNYSSYDKVCTGDAAHVPSDVRTRYHTAFSANVPTNLCDLPNADYTPVDVGNIAMAAGGFHPDDGGTVYSGGDITLGSNTQIYGSALAGDVFRTGGQVVINGIVNAGSSGEGGENLLSGNTMVIDNNPDDDFEPTSIPNMNPDGASNEYIVDESHLLWVRYPTM